MRESTRKPALVVLIENVAEYKNSLKVSAAAEVGFFLILLVYALTGLTYNFKKMDEFMCVTWIAYFLFSFRPVIKIGDQDVAQEQFYNRKRTNTSQFIRDVDFAFKGAQELVSDPFDQNFVTKLMFR